MHAISMFKGDEPLMRTMIDTIDAAVRQHGRKAALFGVCASAMRALPHYERVDVIETLRQMANDLEAATHTTERAA